MIGSLAGIAELAKESLERQQSAPRVARRAGRLTMRWDVFAWAAVALLLFAAEAMAPGAFMLWLGPAAAATFVIVLLAPGMAVLTQVVVFAILSVVAILVWQRWFRGRAGQRPAGAEPAHRRAGRARGAAGTRRIVDGHGRADRRRVLGSDRPRSPAHAHVRRAGTA